MRFFLSPEANPHHETQPEHRRISAIEKRLSHLAEKLDAIEPSTAPPVQPGSSKTETELVMQLQERIESLEKTLERLVDPGKTSARDRLTRSFEALNAGSSQEYQENTAGEALFNNDEGRPLGFDEESIADAVRATKNPALQIQDAYCKSSSCKITFADPGTRLPDDPAESVDPGNLLIMELTEMHEGDGLDFYYARDEQGNQVMYIHSPRDSGQQ